MKNTPARFVSYVRVSTQKQGASGLGLEAQQSAIAAHLARCGGQSVGEFVEVETGKGTNALTKRPQLAAALALAKAQRATLVIAKLDRLARNVHFISGLMETKARGVALGVKGRENVAALNAERQEAGQERAEALRGALEGMKARGLTLRAMAGELAALGHQTANGKPYSAAQVSRLLARILEVSAKEVVAGATVSAPCSN